MARDKDEKLWTEKYKLQNFSILRETAKRDRDCPLIRIINRYLEEGCRVLEAGCGTGRLIAALKFWNRDKVEAHGIDYSSGSIRLTKKLFRELGTKGNFTRGDLCAIPYPDNYFDLVFNESTLEHIPDYEKAMSEIARVTKRNGLVIISVPNKLRPDASDLYKHIMREGFLQVSFTPWQLRGLFRKNNLNMVETFGYGTISYRTIYALAGIIKKKLNMTKKSADASTECEVGRPARASKIKDRLKKLDNFVSRIIPKGLHTEYGIVGVKE